MGLSRYLAKLGALVGSDGRVGNAGISDLDASKLNAGLLPTARLGVGSVPVISAMADSGGTAQWLYLGQWDTLQMGYRIHIKMFNGAGFNADVNQNSLVDIYFKTSNNISSQAGSSANFYGDGFVVAYMAGSAGVSPSIVRVVQTSATSYKFYAYVGTYTAAGSYFTVDASPGTTWTSAVTWTAPTGNYVDLGYRNMLATTNTGGVSNQANSFVIPINPVYGTSIVTLRGRHDTGVATAYMGTFIDGVQQSMEASLWGQYRGNSAWADGSSGTWNKLHPNTLAVDANLDWGGQFVVHQTYNSRPGVMVDFYYTYTAQGAARTTGCVSRVGNGSITGLVFDFDIASGTQNMWAEWQVVGIK